MEIIIPDSVAQKLGRMSIQVQRRIATKMRFYASQKDPLSFAKHLTN